jgi:hypothetical protein
MTSRSIEIFDFRFSPAKEFRCSSGGVSTEYDAIIAPVTTRVVCHGQDLRCVGGACTAFLGRDGDASRSNGMTSDTDSLGSG